MDSNLNRTKSDHSFDIAVIWLVLFSFILFSFVFFLYVTKAFQVKSLEVDRYEKLQGVVRFSNEVPLKDFEENNGDEVDKNIFFNAYSDDSDSNMYFISEREEVNYLSPDGLSDIKDGISQEFFAKAIAYRDGGDMVSAIKSLNKVNEIHPNHPRVLYELGVCYEDINNLNRAREIWRRIYKLGLKAGSLYDIVATKLGKSVVKGDSLFNMESNSKMLSFSNVSIDVKGGGTMFEIIKIGFHIRAEPGVSIDKDKVTPLLIVVDRLDDGRLVLSNMLSSEEFLSPPLDWNKSPEEIFRFTFTRKPSQINGEINNAGRSYYGFKAIILYDNETQDMISKPKELRDMNFNSYELPYIDESGIGSSGNSLFYAE